MTSASELFYQRRTRLGRSAAGELGLEPFSTERSYHQTYNRRHHNNNNQHQHQHHHHHNGRQDLDGCDPLRRSPHVRRYPCSRHYFTPDRASVPLDESSSQLVSSNNLGSENVGNTSRPRWTGNDRLPGAVLLARARLLERLRGVSLSGSRQSGRTSLGIYSRENTLGDDLQVVDAGDGGTSISLMWSSRGPPFPESTSQSEWPQWELESVKKKPPGLTAEALNCLKIEVFSCLERGVEEEVPQVSWDCSICLESFMEGDELVCLPCEHRFHSSCLDPWIRICGDCPYCRRDISVSGPKS